MVHKTESTFGNESDRYSMDSVDELVFYNATDLVGFVISKFNLLYDL